MSEKCEGADMRMLKGHSVYCREFQGAVKITCRVFFNKGIVEVRPLVLRSDNAVKNMSLGRHMLVEEATVAQEFL